MQPNSHLPKAAQDTPEPEKRDVTNNSGIEPSGQTDLPVQHVCAPHDEFVGKTILQHYEILELLGSGGMSVVYKARHTILNQTVAVKMLHPHLAKNGNTVLRFRQEAQSASRLDHEGIVGLRDFGILPNDRPYLIMDYVPGRSLAAVLAEEKLEPKRALNICLKICRALAHAHSKGVIHRDIKPSNVMIINENCADEWV